jgi:DNA-binding Lrp family transcriptional regulator
MINMPSAYVLINCDLGSEESIIKEIAHFDGVKRVDQIQGVYDIMVWLESDNPDQLKDSIKQKIKGIPKVRSTLTLMVVDRTTS